MAAELLQTDSNSELKTNLLKQISNYPQILLQNTYYTKNLFTNLDKTQLKLLSKTLVKSYQNDPNIELFQNEAIINNKELLQSLTLKIAKNISECMENTTPLTKALNKNSFEICSFIKEIDLKDFFNSIQLQNQDEAINNVEILKHLQIYYLDENSQLTAIFVLLILKKCCQSKKLRKNIDYVLQSIYELSPKYPDLYKMFPVSYIFDFKNNIMLELLKLSNKTSNKMLIIKNILESGVKKVKTDAEIVKTIVDILLKNHKKKGEISSIDYFSDSVFQISCIILPIIAKEKKAITTSAYRSILANLQDKLNNAMLDSFKNIDFSNNSNLCVESGNTDDSVVSENTLATLTAMGAYSLTLLKCCETTDAEEIKNLDCLWSGLEYFVINAVSHLLFFFYFNKMKFI